MSPFTRRVQATAHRANSNSYSAMPPTFGSAFIIGAGAGLIGAAV